MRYFDRTLVVEDDCLVRGLLGKFLQRANLGYDLAEDGKIALKKIDEQAVKGLSYRTILTDLTMPNLDGVHLIELIGERVGRGEILRPEIYVLTGGHKDIENVESSPQVRRIFEKTLYKEAVNEIKSFYDSLRV